MILRTLRSCYKGTPIIEELSRGVPYSHGCDWLQAAAAKQEVPKRGSWPGLEQKAKGAGHGYQDLDDLSV